MTIISGTLRDGAGMPVEDCVIRLKALNTTSAVIVTTTASVGTDAGKYRIEAQPGRYAVTLEIAGWPPQSVGHIEVSPDSPDASLNDFLRDIQSEDLTSEAMKQFRELASQARDSATRAETAEKSAAVSADGAAGSRDAAALSEKNAAESEGQSGLNAAAAQRAAERSEVAEKSAAGSADSAAKSREAAVRSEKNAADSETQCADSAAESEQSARRAESAQVAAETAAAGVDVHEAPEDGVCYVRRNGAWVRQDVIDVAVAESDGALNVLSQQVFRLDGTRDNTVTLEGLPEGRAVVIVLVLQGRGGEITWPEGLAWSLGEIPSPGATRTVITLLWDGETLTGTTALTV
ncbi:prophage tail fiber N-terminal domain-containing protein [Citrobacter meridianamericanus]|uniref:prophage tail fiber N-terminal domain-containing protein n=1 Tax=Citrobacter meridianamericanus TaxID=2894201 RepID=UPI00351D7AEE